MKKYNLGENINLTIVPTEKFKDNVISIRFVLDLDADKASSRSLLAFMLTNRTKQHPTNQELTSYLDDLYGMSISMNTYSIGACHLLELRCHGLADRFVHENISLLKKQIALLQEVLYEPLVDDQGLIDTELFEEAKMIMQSRIRRRKDDPTSYALEENSQRIGKGTPFAISCLGEENQLETVTREDVKKAYEDVLMNSIIDIYVIGSVKEDTIVRLLKEKLPFESRNTSYEIFYSWPQQSKPQFHEIQRDIDQSSLVMTWLTDINITHPLFYSLKVANGIFGGDSNSLLFKVVREEHSLCYSIHSSVYAMDEVMMGLAGIGYEDKDKAVSLIKEQFEKVKQGDFADDDMETSKRLFINGLQSQFDSAGGMINFLYQQKISGLHKSVEEIIEMISAVTKEDVVKAMNQVSLAGIFVLKERDGVADENDEE